MNSAFDITFVPLVPLWLIAIGAGLALVLFLLGWFNRATGSLPRLLVAAALLTVLLNPAVLVEERQLLKDIAVVVVDETPSQEIGTRGEETGAAVNELTSALGKFERDLETRIVRSRHRTVDEAEEGSRLLDNLEEAMADIPANRFAGAVLLTDGRVHGLPDNPANSGAAPIHALVTGAPGEGDRRIELVDVPGYGLVGQTAELTLKVEEEGARAKAAKVRVEANGKLVATLTTPIGRERKLRVPLEHRGKTVVLVEVEAGPQEMTLRNNRAVVTINAVRDRLRVLLVSGVPHPGERTWRNLLKSDPSVDLVHFTILRPPEKQDGTPIHELSLIAFPTRELFEVKLRDFDLIVFDRYRRRGVLPAIYLENVVDYVREGGALLEVVGPGFAGPFSLFRTPLSDVLPAEPTGRVIERGFLPRLTEDGLRHPVTGRLPGGPLVSLKDDVRWGRWFRQIEVLRASGHSLMQGADETPLLILDRVGKGRVAQMMSDQIWLWSRGYEGGGPHGELIRRLSHWLMKEPELEENTLTGEVFGSRLTITQRSLLPVEPAIEVTDPDGAIHLVQLKHQGNGRYSGSHQLEQAGLYRLDNGRQTSFVPVGALNSLEFSRVTATTAELAPVVEASGGRVSWLRDGLPLIRRVDPGRAAGGSGWIGLRRNGAYQVTGVDRLPLMPGLLVLLVVFAGLVLAWRREAT